MSLINRHVVDLENLEENFVNFLIFSMAKKYKLTENIVLWSMKKKPIRTKTSSKHYILNRQVQIKFIQKK